MPTGANTYARYKREAGAYTSHSVAGDSTWKVFGHGLKITPTLKNNLQKIGGIGTRQATAIVPGKFEGSVDLEFQLSNPWWLRLLMGQAATKTGAGPYSYYWLDSANENAGGAVTLPNTIEAFTIENGIDLATDSVRLYQGCFLDKASISCSLGAPVDVKLTAPFRTITKGTASIASQAVDTESPFIFAYGALKLPTGTTLANVQNVTLEINNNVELIGGIGSRLATAGIVRGLETSIKASMYFVADADVLDYMLGSTTVPGTPTSTTLDLTFDNGLGTTSQRLVSFKFTGVQIEDDVLAQAIENPLIEDFTPIAQTMTLCKAINNTASEV